MRILFIGDIVGKPGYRAVCRLLPQLRQRESLDLVVANAENAADGSGLTPGLYAKLLHAGVDGMTLGDHIYRRGEIIPLLISEANLVKPANYPANAPGRQWMLLPAANGVQVAVWTVLGRLYMRPVDCPFAACDRVLRELPESVKVRIVDVHAEATSDKQLLGRYLNGRVTAVLGTHTHVVTADEQILSQGTAFQCDVGMTGPFDSILGRKVERVLETTISFRPTQYQVATGDVRICGTLIDADAQTGKALSIRRLCLSEPPVGEAADAEP